MSPERRQGWRFELFGRRSLAVLAVLLSVCAAVLLSAATKLTPYVRQRVEQALSERFDSRVELKSFRVALFPRVSVHGEGLALRHKGRTDVPPLISIKSFSAGAGLWGLIRKPLHVYDVTLDGLDVQVPPGGLDGDDDDANDEEEDRQREKAAVEAAKQVVAEGVSPPAEPSSATSGRRSPLIVDRLVTRNARVVILRRKLGKRPRVFEIHDLVMTEIGLDRAAKFDASLTNPTPKGLIKARGEFGPWAKEEPRRTPLRADYTFEHADLDTIKGISGILSSTGKFWGVLARIDVEGETDTPDFSVDIAGQKIHLKTRFKAVVDGTSGNTWLNPVEATFLKSAVAARGGVIQRENPKGKSVELDVSIDDALIEDVMKLAVKSETPPLTGQLRSKTRFLLPPGEADVPERLHLAGTFEVTKARFTSFDVQERIEMLSRRGQGDTSKSANRGSVVSNLRGRYVMRNAAISFSSLSFEVPEVQVQLAGSYFLKSEALDFKGYVLLSVPLSETTTGIKSVLLKIVDPFFKNKKGGGKLPIKVTGTRENPSVGLDIKGALTPGD